MRVLSKTDIGDRRTARAPSSTDYSLINRGQRGEQTPNPAASNSMHGTPGRIRIAFRRCRTGLSREIPYLRLEHPMCAILQRATHPFGSEGSSPEPLQIRSSRVSTAIHLSGRRELRIATPQQDADPRRRDRWFLGYQQVARSLERQASKSLLVVQGRRTMCTNMA